jgi:DNA-directed RNA polymerase subunit omega
MADQRSTMIDPPIEQLLDSVDSKFTLVTLAAKRGRQINSYFNQLGEGLGAIVPPQVASVARKPLSIALEEIAAGKVQAGVPVVTPDDQVVDDAEANEPFGAVGADMSELPPEPTVAELVLGVAGGSAASGLSGSGSAFEDAGSSDLSESGSVSDSGDSSDSADLAASPDSAGVAAADSAASSGFSAGSDGADAAAGGLPGDPQE